MSQEEAKAEALLSDLPMEGQAISPKLLIMSQKLFSIAGVALCLGGVIARLSFC